MSKSVDIAGENELEEGTMKAVSAEGKDILLARTREGFYAVDNICPHMKGRLSEGTLDENIVTCPRHGSQFDVRNGEVVRWLKGPGIGTLIAKIIKPPHRLESYRIQIKDGRVLAEIP